MQITRRGFLGRGSGALIASATMAEAGMLAEFLDWVKRKPVSFTAPVRDWKHSLRVFVSSDGKQYVELPDVQSIELSHLNLPDFGKTFPTSSGINVRGRGVCLPAMSDLTGTHLLRIQMPDGKEINHTIRISEQSQTIEPQPYYYISARL